MLTAQPWTESLYTRRFPPQRFDDFALEGTEGNRDSCESPPKGKCLLLFRLSHRCFFILFFSPSHPFHIGRNDFQNNFSLGIFWSSVYLCQPYTSVLHTILIQLGNTRQWLTPPQAQHSARGPEHWASGFFSSITGCPILLKLVYQPAVCQPCFQ